MYVYRFYLLQDYYRWKSATPGNMKSVSSNLHPATTFLPFFKRLIYWLQVVQTVDVYMIEKIFWSHLTDIVLSAPNTLLDCMQDCCSMCFRSSPKAAFAELFHMLERFYKSPCCSTKKL